MAIPRPEFRDLLRDFLESRDAAGVAEMDQRAGDLAEALVSKGIDPGDLAVNNGMLALLAFAHDIVDDACLRGDIDGHTALFATALLVGLAAPLTTMRGQRS